MVQWSLGGWRLPAAPPGMVWSPVLHGGGKTSNRQPSGDHTFPEGEGTGNRQPPYIYGGTPLDSDYSDLQKLDLIVTGSDFKRGALWARRGCIKVADAGYKDFTPIRNLPLRTIPTTKILINRKTIVTKNNRNK